MKTITLLLLLSLSVSANDTLGNPITYYAQYKSPKDRLVAECDIPINFDSCRITIHGDTMKVIRLLLNQNQKNIERCNYYEYFIMKLNTNKR